MSYKNTKMSANTVIGNIFKHKLYWLSVFKGLKYFMLFNQFIFFQKYCKRTVKFLLFVSATCFIE